MSYGRNDMKAIAAIAILYERRRNRSLAQYEELANLIGADLRGIGDILDRVFAWCEVHNLKSLAQLLIGKDGLPGPGAYDFPTDYRKERPVDLASWLEYVKKLYDEDWSTLGKDFSLPIDPDEINAAYMKVVWGKKAAA
jgi:hypothetical protein